MLCVGRRNGINYAKYSGFYPGDLLSSSSQSDAATKHVTDCLHQEHRELSQAWGINVFVKKINKGSHQNIKSVKFFTLFYNILIRKS